MLNAKQAINQFSELTDAIRQDEYIYANEETARNIVLKVLEFIYEDEFMEEVFNRLEELTNDK